MLPAHRIKYLREELEAERISQSELIEIEEAFDKIPDDELRDLRANALASDMLDELESQVSTLEWMIFDFVVENYPDEVNNPSWDIEKLAKHLEKVGFNAVAQIN